MTRLRPGGRILGALYQSRATEAQVVFTLPTFSVRLPITRVLALLALSVVLGSESGLAASDRGGEAETPCERLRGLRVTTPLYCATADKLCERSPLRCIEARVNCRRYRTEVAELERSCSES